MVYGRTLEWGEFDLIRGSSLPARPRVHRPDLGRKTRLRLDRQIWRVRLDALGKDVLVEGMNEKGLAVGTSLFPGFADYETYDPARAAESMSATDVGQYLLTISRRSTTSARRRRRSDSCPSGAGPGLRAAGPLPVTEPIGKAIVLELRRAR